MAALSFTGPSGDAVALSVERDGDVLRIALPDGSVHVVAARRTGPLLLLREVSLDACAPELPARTIAAAVAETERGIEVSYEGAAYVFTAAGAQAAGAGSRRRASTGELASPMPGIVADVLVAEGERVEAYQPLAIVEAMKVMATLEAPFAGTVARVHVRKGQQVRQADPIVEIVRDA